MTRKSRCVICQGSEICIHKHRKSRCLECCGSEICIHKHRREKCTECRHGCKNSNKPESQTVTPIYHNDLSHRCTIKKSLVPRAGLGVFANIAIPANRCIGYFSGRLKHADHVQGTDYCICIDDRVRDGFAFPRGYSAMVNDARGTSFSYNLEFVRIEKKYKIALYTICDIKKGDELYVDYGDEYWKDRQGQTHKKKRT